MKKLIIILTVFLTFASVSTSAVYENIDVFRDVEESDWYFESVITVYQKGIMFGKSPTLFSPHSMMARGELAVILATFSGDSVNGLELVASEKFIDIDENDLYAPFIGWAVQNGIVTGYDNGTFAPDSFITRQELATMVMRFIRYHSNNDLQENPQITAFTDYDDISTWAKNNVEQLRIWGLTEGDENGSFNPKKSASRAETATIIANYIIAVETTTPIINRK